MNDQQKIVYFSDAVFLGGAEEYLKSLIPEVDRDRYVPRVVLCPGPAISPLVEFFRVRGIPVDLLASHDTSPLRNFFGALRYFLKERPTIVHFNLNNSFGC